MVEVIGAPPALAAWTGVLGPAEIHGACAIAHRSGDPLVILGAALALWAPLHGHSCIDLTTVASDLAAETARADLDAPSSVRPASLPWPEPDGWRRTLAASAAVRTATSPCPVLDEHPLVLHGTRLYTQRQWVDECTVAGALRAMAVQDRLSIVVGGPGTGKTHTAGGMLTGLDPARVGLCAPTGKAAARLTESVGHADLQAVTIHRLLGPRPDHRSRFRHDAAHPLPYELVVVDETSMVPLPLMARLLEAVGPRCSLVLVGDPDQLESVEVGSVLGDVVRAAEVAGSPLAGSITRLTRQHRTAAGSPIGSLADAVRTGDADRAVAVLRSSQPEVELVEVGADPTSASAAVRAAIGRPYAAAVEAARAGDGERALAALESARLLCGHRAGPFGVDTWNGIVTQWSFEGPNEEEPGRALLVTRNDLRTGLVNGDTGIVVAGPRPSSRSRAVFRRPGRLREHALSELADVEPAFAMTVHKTQGSEYDSVVVVHPPVDSPLASRELLYTAVTRAKHRLVVVASEAAVRRAVATPTRRITGLADMLAAPGGG